MRKTVGGLVVLLEENMISPNGMLRVLPVSEGPNRQKGFRITSLIGKNSRVWTHIFFEST